MVTIGRVHVAYADASLDIRAGVATEGMRFHTADDNWQQAFERDLRKPILKLVALDRASVYVLPQVRLRGPAASRRLRHASSWSERP